jgi:hypothetical protein
MSTAAFSQFNDLPVDMQTGIKKFRPHDYATFIFESVPALGNRSVIDVMNDGEKGEQAVRDYVMKVLGYFF